MAAVTRDHPRVLVRTAPADDEMRRAPARAAAEAVRGGTRSGSAGPGAAVPPSRHAGFCDQLVHRDQMMNTSIAMMMIDHQGW